jgi:aspartate racemase
MKMLGLIGGMSWESTSIYYRHLNRLARERLGGLHSAKLLLWSFDFAEIAEMQAAGDWDRATAAMVEAGSSLEAAGAQAIVICTNTMHRMAGEVQAAVSIPLIHIADATAETVLRTPCRRPVLLATRFTMEQDFYRGRLARHGIEAVVPDEEGRRLVHRVIYEELCRGEVRPESKAAYLGLIEDLRRREGADGVILGCTEVGLLLDGGDTDLPVFDTTLIHAEQALDFALS